MDDKQIVDLFWERSENAIIETDTKYGKMLHRTSFALLSSDEDAEECVNDTYFAAWNKMPSERPVFLGAFLARIVRNISISKYRSMHRKKRDSCDLVFEELSECISDNDDPVKQSDNEMLKSAINSFINSLNEEKRAVFIRRYFWSQDISVIAKQTNISESNVKTMLFRLRSSLKTMLEKEGLL